MLSLSASDISHLRSTLRCLLAPASYQSVRDWGIDVMNHASHLLGADKALFCVTTSAGLNVAWQGEKTAEAVTDYLTYYWQADTALLRRRQLGLEVHHRDDLYTRGELREDVLYNEWCIPHALLDTLGMVVEIDDAPIPALIHVYHETTRRRFGQNAKQLMHLLLPSFKASVGIIRLLDSQSAAVGSMIDSMAEAVCMADERGKIIHANPVFARLIEKEPAPELMDAIRRVIQEVGGSVRRCDSKGSNSSILMRPNRSIVVRGRNYSISGTSVEAFDLHGVMVLIHVREDKRNEPFSTITESAALGAKLTRREVQVASCLCARLQNAEIAERLGISVHTVRHHAENVFAKLGVDSRQALRRMLQRSANTERI